MSESTRTTWIDLTDLSSWRGHMTGTQRVTFEVARSYFEHAQATTRFFVYDNRSRAFYEVSFQPLLDIILADKTEQSAAHTTTNRGFHRPSIKGVAKAQSLRVYHALPYSVKRKITSKQKEQFKKIYHRSSAFANSVRQQRPAIIQHAVKTGQPLSFDKNDTVLILGKPWDTMSFIDILRDKKLSSNFKLVHLIYDMVPSFLPHVFGQPLPRDYTRYMFEAISLSDQLIAISQSTKRDVERFCKEELLPVPPIDVVKLGDDPMPPIQREGEVGVAGLRAGSYILCVGTVEIRKNHVLLYTAYREGIRRGYQLPKLVIVGSKGWYTSDVLYEFANDPEFGLAISKLSLHDLSFSLRRLGASNCRITGIWQSLYCLQCFVYDRNCRRAY
jgi:glycosyltransferase involved in cell wall biosynthesis